MAEQMTVEKQKKKKDNPILDPAFAAEFDKYFGGGPVTRPEVYPPRTPEQDIPWKQAARSQKVSNMLLSSPSPASPSPPADNTSPSIPMGKLNALLAGLGKEPPPGSPVLGGEQPPEITPLPKAQPVEQEQDPLQAIQKDPSRLRKLEAMRDISEGLGAIGTGVKRGIMHTVGRDPNSVQPFIAEGIRTKIDEERDTIDPQNLAALEKVFGTLPQNMTWTQLHAVLPSYARRQDAQENREFRQDYMDREAERKDADAALRREKFETLTPQQNEDIALLDNALEISKQIEYEKPKFDTGPLAGRWHSMAGWVGMNDPEKAKFKQKVQSQLNEYLLQMSGRATFKYEIGRLRDVIPTMEDNDEVFQAKLGEFMNILNTKRKTLLTNMEKMGKNVTEYQPQPEEDYDYAIPASDTAAIEEAKKLGVKYKVIQ